MSQRYWQRGICRALPIAPPPAYYQVKARDVYISCVTFSTNVALEDFFRNQLLEIQN